MRRAALTAEATRTVAAVVGFLVLARALSLSDIGQLVALTAIVSLASPFLTLGLPLGLTRNAARGTLTVEPGDAVRSLAAYSTLVGVPPLLACSFLLVGSGWTQTWPLVVAEVMVVVTAAASSLSASPRETGTGSRSRRPR